MVETLTVFPISILRPWMLAQMIDKEYCQAKKVEL